MLADKFILFNYIGDVHQLPIVLIIISYHYYNGYIIMDIMTGENLSPIYVNMDFIYWSVRSSSRREGVDGGIVILARCEYRLLEYIKICHNIYLIIIRLFITEYQNTMWQILTWDRVDF